MSVALDAVTAMRTQKIVPIVRTKTKEQARLQCRVLIEAGYRVLEITLTTPGAIDLIRQLAQTDSLTLGAGSILSADQVQQAADAGASFAVSPVNPNWFVSRAHAAGIAALPGAATPDEAYRAAEEGADLVKIFPVQRLGGTDFIRDLLAPMPNLSLMATGGVPASHAAALLTAGCIAVGLGSILSDPILGTDPAHRARAALEIAGSMI